jgi:hypothetical protein
VETLTVGGYKHEHRSDAEAFKAALLQIPPVGSDDDFARDHDAGTVIDPFGA